MSERHVHFDTHPDGSYSIEFDPIEGCPRPAVDRDWRYFSEALAWYPGHGLTGAQTFGVVQQVQAALRDGRITPADLGMERVSPASGSGLLDLSDRTVWEVPS